MNDHFNLVGLTINNRYRVLHVLGTGSFATVYLAIDLLNKKKVAVKCLSKVSLNEGQQQDQKKELELMTIVHEHPNIVTLLDYLETEKVIFLVMEHCEMDLYEAITKKGGFPEDVVKEVFLQLVNAVSYCHEHGIYHRDIKPENCLIASDYTVKLTDFGLSTMEKWSFELGCGSVRYMAPECLGVDAEMKHGYSTAQNDVWSLGVILVNLLFGKNPWHEASLSDPLFSMFCQQNPNLLQDQFDLTDEFNVILKKVFRKDPKGRCTLSQLKDYIQRLTFFTRSEREKSFAEKDMMMHSVSGQPFSNQSMFCIFNYGSEPTTPMHPHNPSTDSCFSDLADEADEVLMSQNEMIGSTPITPKENLQQFSTCYPLTDAKFFSDMPLIIGKGSSPAKQENKKPFFGPTDAWDVSITL